MTKIFWDHLTHYHETISLLDSYTLDPDDKQDLVNIIDEIFHHHTLNVILNHLPKVHHEEFIRRLKVDPTDPKLLGFIKEKIDITVNIEAEIKTQSKKVHADLVREIKKHKKR